MTATIATSESGHYTVNMRGRSVFGPESYVLASLVAWYLNNPERWDYSEACEVARVIAKDQREHDEAG